MPPPAPLDDWDDDLDIELDDELDDDDPLDDAPYGADIVTPEVPSLPRPADDGWPEPVQALPSALAAGDDLVSDEHAYVSPGSPLLTHPRRALTARQAGEPSLPLSVLWLLLVQSAGIAAVFTAMSQSLLPQWPTALRFAYGTVTVGLSAVTTWLVARRVGPSTWVAAALVTTPLLLWLTPQMFPLFASAAAAAVTISMERRRNA